MYLLHISGDSVLIDDENICCVSCVWLKNTTILMPLYYISNILTATLSIHIPSGRKNIVLSHNCMKSLGATTCKPLLYKLHKTFRNHSKAHSYASLTWMTILMNAILGDNFFLMQSCLVSTETPFRPWAL